MEFIILPHETNYFPIPSPYKTVYSSHFSMAVADGQLGCWSISPQNKPTTITIQTFVLYCIEDGLIVVTWFSLAHMFFPLVGRTISWRFNLHLMVSPFISTIPTLSACGPCTATIHHSLPSAVLTILSHQDIWWCERLIRCQYRHRGEFERLGVLCGFYCFLSRGKMVKSNDIVPCSNISYN